MTHILALDADTRNVGYAFGTETEYRSGEQIDFSHKGDIDTRRRFILVWFWALLLRSEPDYVAIETPVVGKNARAALQLARLGGNLEAAAIITHAKVLWIHPSTAKAALAHGKASKKEMVKAATLIVGRPVAGHHHADAIGVLMAAQGELTQRKWEADA